MSEPFIGEIRLFGFTFAPRGWATCQGQLLAIQQNQALFSLLGTTYGGNGQTTFGLPDLRGRSAVAWGQGPGLTNIVQGETGGQENRTLNSNNLPAHTHAVTPPVASSASSKNPAGNVPGFTATSASYEARPDGAGQAFESGLAGGNQPFGIRSPFLGLNYCIALEGIFPSRN